VNEKKKESRSGMEIMNLLQVRMLDELPFVLASYFVLSLISSLVHRKRGGSVVHGMERRRTMNYTKRLYVELIVFSNPQHLSFL